VSAAISRAPPVIYLYVAHQSHIHWVLIPALRTPISVCIVLFHMQLILQPAKIFGIQLGPSKSIERVFDVLYLDEKVRVVEFLPDQSPNSNSSEPVLFVLRRLSDVQHPQSGRQVCWTSGNCLPCLLSQATLQCALLTFLAKWILFLSCSLC
jgi:hypothetical protein